eukprot:scaffold22086_cov71-Cyclotella_meneghiniana.AAC.9
MRSSTISLPLLLLLQAVTAFQPARNTFSRLLIPNSKLDALKDSREVTRHSFLVNSAKTVASSFLISTPSIADDIAAPPKGAAIYAYRSGGLARLTTLGLAKLLTRYEGYVTAPSGYSKSQIPICFDFPTDWLQLDKLGGGVQYVDQRNGDKLYVLHAILPDGADLKSVNKQWFADAILSPEGDIARSGVVAEGGRVSSSKMIVDCNAEDAPKSCMARRRMVLKYDTVTGSGVQTVERRGLVDAYQVGGDVYMMLTTSNAVKFDNKDSKERQTVENIVSSFKVGDAALL